MSPFTILDLQEESWVDVLARVKELGFELSADELKIWQEEIEEELFDEEEA